MRWFNPILLPTGHLAALGVCGREKARSRSSIASELEMTARPEHDRDDDDPEDAEDHTVSYGH